MDQPQVEQESTPFDEEVSTPPELCLNCGNLLTGSYCSSCGQKKRQSRIRFREFLHDLVHEFLHLDGKFARTMFLLIAKPGLLTIEFLAGRRARYVSPLRLYLIWSAVFFTLAIAFPGAVVLRTGNTSAPGKLSVQLPGIPHPAEAPAVNGAKETDNPERDFQSLSETFLHDAAKGMFLLMPFLGFLLYLFYRKRERFYLPHLYFSIHYHAYVFLAMSVIVLMKAPKIGALTSISSFVELSILVYLYLALRRVYGASRLGTALRMIGAGFIYILGLAATFLAILVFRVLQD